MLRHIFLVAKNTYLETVRDRIILGASFIAFLAILFSVFVGSISFDQDIHMIIDLSLSAIYLLQVFIALFVGSTLFQREIDRKTLFLLIPKVIKRDVLLLGKALGLFIVIVLVTLISTALLSVIVIAKGGSAYLYGIGVATLFGFLEIPILILLALFFSLFTSSVLSALFGLSFFLIGHSQSILQAIIVKTKTKTLAYFLKLFYFGLPNLEKCNIRNDIIYKALPDGKMFLLTVLYVAVYSIILFFLARTLLNKKEF
jgi:ABC-type transport system involved in multi-copper enzyme maturation permease subunit